LSATKIWRSSAKPVGPVDRAKRDRRPVVLQRLPEQPGAAARAEAAPHLLACSKRMPLMDAFGIRAGFGEAERPKGGFRAINRRFRPAASGRYEELSITIRSGRC
jgi:hypothetical protein